MSLSLILTFIIPVGLVLFFKLINKQNKPPICGVYQQNTKFFWFKFAFMYVVLQLRQLKNSWSRQNAVDTGKSDDGNIHVHTQDVALESKYNLNGNPQAIDAVYFNGVNPNGDAVICGLARRLTNVDSFLYLKINREELLLSPVLPDTYQIQNKDEEGEYKINGLEIVNFIPMRTWKVTYNGDMKPRNNTEKSLKVKVDLIWSAVFAPFNYDNQMSPKGLARDMAREKWSREHFKLLEKLHQTHYEQMGVLDGTVTIDGKETPISIPAVRDHSFGPFRDWRTFHRYVYHFIFLENGDRMAIGTVCQPAILSHLTIGYLCRQSDQAVLSVESSDFQLYQHGEHQVLPRDYAFSFKAGCQSYTVRLQVNDEDTFYIGKSREAKFYERWCSVDVNGIKGKACVEWHYNNQAESS
ncbi:uncharacterized protein LOC113491987 [Trichoplusia ni]|uniref:Uncharacterized protein LOC113491987 n=1 Tax=Trichoplusia ni TaxID=7111 RepID=A0A7E5V9S8_TRINI|nr:uncharacterized protein LOC113491987 [Trichoplusia ni]